MTGNYEIYRKPEGALPEDTYVDLYINIDVNRIKEIESVNLTVIYDDSQTKVYEVNRDLNLNGVYSYRLKVSKGLYFYSFEVKYKDGVFNSDKRQITVYDKNYKTPDSFKGGIMYQIFVDRFAKSDNFTPEVRDGLYMHESTCETPFYKPGKDGEIRNEDIYGGSFPGIIEKLDYLKELNIDIIYLCPVFEANSNHKYNTCNFEKTDDMFGGDETFGRLIEEAKSRGIKIILDGVFNHVGDDSIYFDRYNKNKGRNINNPGAYQSKESKYYGWFTFNDWDNDREDYESWWGIKSLPSIKKDEPVFRAYICGVNGIIEKWLKKGVAGYRIDVADELSDRMLRGINKAVKETSEENIIIGEVWEDATNKIAYGQRRRYLLGGQLDSVMNYPLKDALINYLRTKNSRIMREVMENITNNYPKQSIDCLMNIVGTHDTMRILTALGSEEFTESKDKMAESKLSRKERENGVFLLKAAALMQMTLPGIPCIYYGDEAGMEGYGDPFNRRFFPWENIDCDINNFYRKICKIRNGSKNIFSDGEYRLILEEDGLFCYAREKDGEKIYICVNLSESSFVLPDFGESLLSGENITEIEPDSFDIFIIGDKP
ncbi:MAG: glycoside hydrolase family 13 protein [Oscillospiraceae bacterium]|nr:glycoside hydrolase family 13 protein [Oscillospiraceae bacterium]